RRRRPPSPTLCPYTTLFRSWSAALVRRKFARRDQRPRPLLESLGNLRPDELGRARSDHRAQRRVGVQRIAKAVLTRQQSAERRQDRKSTRLNSSHLVNSYAV